MSLLFPEIKILLFKYLDALQCLAIVDSSEDDCLETEINFMKKTKHGGLDLYFIASCINVRICNAI